MTSYSTTKNIENISRNGSSFEKSIIAKSINDKYKYVRKVCSDCQLLGQSLAYNKKIYGILTLKKPNSKSVSYYFDISFFLEKVLNKAGILVFIEQNEKKTGISSTI